MVMTNVTSDAGVGATVLDEAKARGIVSDK